MAALKTADILAETLPGYFTRFNEDICDLKYNDDGFVRYESLPYYDDLLEYVSTHADKNSAARLWFKAT